jgi:uncharacterized membrane protein YheB (UPF0754 family)
MDTVDFSQVIVTVISVLISGGLLTLIGDRLKRRDAKEDKHDEVKDKLDKLEESFSKAIQDVRDDISALSDNQEQQNAIDARRNILRFNDELINEVKHSNEMFMQILDDIALYDSYCDSHKGFINGRTVQAAANIRRTYERLFDKHQIDS